MSIFKNTKKTTITVIFFLFLIIILSVGYYFFFLKKPAQYGNYSENMTTIEKLNITPEYLQVEKLTSIKSMLTIEYLRTRMLHHKYANPNDPEEACIFELEREFPGERGRVLSDILKVYNHYEREKEKIYNETELDNYQKKGKERKLRATLFGENIEPIFFPVTDLDIIDTFYLYSDRYLKKHFEDEPKSKRNHLELARQEIYGAEFERLKLLEPFHKRFELELKIVEREMSILSIEERKEKIAELRTNLRRND